MKTFLLIRRKVFKEREGYVITVTYVMKVAVVILARAVPVWEVRPTG